MPTQAGEGCQLAAPPGQGNAVLVILRGPGYLWRGRRLSIIIDAWAGCKLFNGLGLNYSHAAPLSEPYSPPDPGP